MAEARPKQKRRQVGPSTDVDAPRPRWMSLAEASAQRGQRGTGSEIGPKLGASWGSSNLLRSSAGVGSMGWKSEGAFAPKVRLDLTSQNSYLDESRC